MAGRAPWALDPAPPAVQASLEPITRFFSYHDAHPIALTMVLMKAFSHDWLQWEPEVLKSEILTTFRATSVSEHNWQKIQAVRTLLNATGFWAEWEVFEKIVQAFNNNVPVFEVTQRCTLGQLMSGVDIASQIREEEFSDEVRRYIVACAIDQGVVYLPEPLSFAQKILDNPQYECLDCGRVGDVDLDRDDASCDFCTGRFEHDHPFSGARAPWVPEHHGKNIKQFFGRSPEKVAKRFKELKGRDSSELDEESVEDVQAAKLVIAHKYMQKRRADLVAQLEELKTWVTR